MTNREWLNSLSDTELLLDDSEKCDRCAFDNKCKIKNIKYSNTPYNCILGYEYWVKKEHKQEMKNEINNPE